MPIRFDPVFSLAVFQFIQYFRNPVKPLFPYNTSNHFIPAT